jgi:GT2 family glycosyltransferase
MSAQSVHVVVVAYHAPEQLERCLAGLEQQFRTTVVDNSSLRDIAVVAERHGASYVDAGANLGFAAGVNVALSQLQGNQADVLLVNPDAVITPDTVDVLARYLHRHESAHIAAVAPRLIGPDETEQRLVWPFPSPRRMWLEAAGLGRLAGSHMFVIGAVLLLRREAIDDIGLFDERFFLYAEETDWQRRALEKGWTSAVSLDAIAEHTGGGASADERRRELLFYAAQETYIRKWYGRRGWCSYRIAACVGGGVRSLVLTQGRRRAAARRTLLYLRGPCRCAALRPK